MEFTDYRRSWYRVVSPVRPPGSAPTLCTPIRMGGPNTRAPIPCPQSTDLGEQKHSFGLKTQTHTFVLIVVIMVGFYSSTFVVFSNHYNVAYIYIYIYIAIFLLLLACTINLILFLYYKKSIIYINQLLFSSLPYAFYQISKSFISI